MEIVFYDTTSLHFEIDDEDKGDDAGQMRGSDAAGARRYVAPRKRGYSKNGRGDAPQIVVGLAVTRDGFPVRHWVFPGNTVDVTSVAQVKEDPKGWQLTRCLFVGDAGMVSQANFQALAKGGGKYLMAMPMRRGDEVTEAGLSRPGRYRKSAVNLEVKEVVGRGGGPRRGTGRCTWAPRCPAAATRCASTRRRPAVSVPIATSASANSKPSLHAWPIRTRADTASACARCAAVPATGAC